MQQKRLRDGTFLVAFDDGNIHANHYHVAEDGTILSVKENGDHRYNRSRVRSRIIDVLGFEDWSARWEKPKKPSFRAICSRCSCTVELPFQPDASRPFLCKTCQPLEKERRERERREREEEKARRQQEWEQRQRERERREQQNREEWESRKEERLKKVSEAIDRMNLAVKRDEETVNRFYRQISSLRSGGRSDEIRRDLHRKIADVEKAKSDKIRKINDMFSQKSKIQTESYQSRR